MWQGPLCLITTGTWSINLCQASDLTPAPRAMLGVVWVHGTRFPCSLTRQSLRYGDRRHGGILCREICSKTRVVIRREAVLKELRRSSVSNSELHYIILGAAPSPPCSCCLPRGHCGAASCLSDFDMFRVTRFVTGLSLAIAC